MAEETATDYTELKTAIVDTVSLCKLFFIPDIAAHLKVTGDLAYQLMTELCEEDRLTWDYTEGQVRRYHIPDDGAEPAAATPEKDPAAATEKDHIRALTNQTVQGEPGFEKLDRDEIKRRVLASIDAEYRTLAGMKRHIGAPMSFDLGDILDDMESDYEIRRVPAGPVTATFRFSTMPIVCRLVGDGRVEADFDTNFVARPPDVEMRKRAELNNEKYKDDDLLELDGPPKAKDEIDEEQLEDLAARFLDMRLIAVELGIAYGPLKRSIATSKVLQAAYDRGRHRNADIIARNSRNAPPAKAHPTPAAPVQTRTGAGAPPVAAGEVIMDEKIFDLAQENPDKDVMAKALNVTRAALETMFDKEPALKRAWKQGRAVFTDERRPATDEPEETPDEPIQQSEETMADTGAAPARACAPKRISYSNDMFRNATAAGKSKTDLAGDLGVTYQAINQQLKRYPEYQKAWDEGIEIYKKTDPQAMPAPPEAPSGRGVRLDITPEQMEEAAATHSSLRQIAQAVGYSQGTNGLTTRMEREPELREAYDRGVARHAAANGTQPGELHPGRGKSRTPAAEPKTEICSACTTPFTSEPFAYEGPIPPEASDAPVPVFCSEECRSEHVVCGGVITEETPGMHEAPGGTRLVGLTPSGIDFDGPIKSGLVMQLDEEERGGQSRGSADSLIGLRTGRIAVAMEVNLLNETREDREAIMTFIDAFQALRDRQANGGPAS